MWNSHESVYKIIKPSEAYHAFTPPQSAKELRDRKVDEITLRLKQTMRLKAAATFGRPLGSFRPSARNFLRKHSKDATAMHEAREEEARSPKRAAGPNRSKCPKKPKRYALRRGFATVPTYLASRMRTLTNQNNKDNLEQQAADCGHKGTRKLDEKERITLMNNLKLKWADMNARYQRMSVVLDIESKKRRKERYEENLSQLERDIALLSRSVILVSDSVPAKVQKALTQ
uniref:Enkurin domain-containing protein n=1 Tax=Physcomitrium patens TaxID=3218 RepID=A0A7I4DUI1_PHYPA